MKHEGARYIFGHVMVLPGETQKIAREVTHRAFRANYLTVEYGFDCDVRDVEIAGDAQMLQPICAALFRPTVWDPARTGTDDVVSAEKLDLPSAVRGAYLVVVVSNPTKRTRIFRARLNGVAAVEDKEGTSDGTA